MTILQTVDVGSVPGFAPGVRIQFDKARQSWVIQAPEKIFLLDEIAYAVVSRCDGRGNLGTIIQGLCGLYTDAPRGVIEADVVKLIQDFVDKGVMAL